MRRADAVLEADRPADDRLDEDLGEDECEHSGEGAGEKAAPDDLLFHCVVSPCASVAGEAEEVPGVVDELVDVRVVAEHRRRTLIHADEVEHQQREECGERQPDRRLGGGEVDRGCSALRASGVVMSRFLSGMSRPVSGVTTSGLTLTVARPFWILTRFLRPSITRAS